MVISNYKYEYLMQTLICVHFNLKLVTAEAIFQNTSIAELLENVNCLYMEDVGGMETDSMMPLAVQKLAFHQVRIIMC